jgi:hypothetical protein
VDGEFLLRRALLSGLCPNTSYVFSIQLASGTHKGPPSEHSRSITTHAITAPAAVDPPVIVEEGVDSVTLTWRRPYDDGGSVVTTYVAAYRHEPLPHPSENLKPLAAQLREEQTKGRERERERGVYYI